MTKSILPPGRCRHWFGGLIIDSDVRIDLLPNADFDFIPAGAPRIKFRIATHSIFSGGELAYTWRGRQDLSLYKTTDDWVFRYHAGTEFRTNSTGSDITCYPGLAGWSPAIMELLVRRILPRVIVLQNRQVIHGASLTTPYGGILVCGRSHAGKSTLAASLAQNLSWGLLDDDTSVLTEHVGPDGNYFKLHPAAERASLWSDSLAALSPGIVHSEPMHVADGKYRCEVSCKPEREGQRLSAIYRLEMNNNISEQEIVVDSLSPQDAMATLVGQQVRFNPTDPAAEAKRLAALARITGSVPIRTLTYQKVYERLPDICDRIREDLATVSTQLACK
ncbi:MAG TPA: hypothetical protein VFC63_27605 [Blastocatellia bacterium]|nr:hypothetical protein [Blastocatellia bacterium]